MVLLIISHRIRITQFSAKWDELSYMQNSLFSLSILPMRMKRFILTVSTMEKVNFVCSLSRPTRCDYFLMQYDVTRVYDTLQIVLGNNHHSVAYLYSFSKIRIRYDCWIKRIQIKSYLIYDFLSLIRNAFPNVPSRFLQTFRLQTRNEI